MTEEEYPIQENEPAQTELPRPGKRLREAREAKGLSIQEVASQLRLQQRLIEALEADNEAGLPPATFVSGYLRSYARLLDLPEEGIVPPSSTASEPPLVATIADKEEASSSDWPARLVTYIVITAIIVSVAMWWVAKREVNVETPPVVQPAIVEQGGSVSLELPENESQPTMPPAVSTEDQSGTEADIQAEPAAEATPAESAGGTVQTPAEPKQEEATTAQSTTPPPLTAAIPQSTLELRFHADSWTEITDSAGRQLAYGLVKQGNDLVLKGEAPFRVFLGYAPGVDVYYNGELFDHSPFQRRDVARFRVGRAEHNHPGSR